MGLMRKAARRAVRKATPQPVRQVQRAVTHPVRTSVRAVTPRPIRNAERAVFNATHPVNTMENALLNGLTGSPRRRKSRPNGPRRSTAAATLSGGYAPSSYAAAVERAEAGAQIAQAERLLFRAHLQALPRVSRGVAPAPEPPDPTPLREHLEGSSGAADINDRLAPFGEPPAAPPPGPVDVAAIERALYADATSSVSWWRFGERRTLRTQTRDEAARQAEAEAERNAAEQRELQQQLDRDWSELGRLRAQVEADVQRWVAEEAARRDAARADEQAKLDARWRKVMANDPETVLWALRSAFPDPQVAVLGSTDGEATVAVTFPAVANVIADAEPGYTPSGRPTVHKRTKTRVNELYLAAVTSRVLRVASAALTAAPALRSVRCVVVRPGDSAGLEPIYAGTFSRGTIDQLRTSSHWSDNPDVLAAMIEHGHDVALHQRGRTREVIALDARSDLDFRAAVERLASVTDY